MSEDFPRCDHTLVAVAESLPDHAADVLAREGMGSPQRWSDGGLSAVAVDTGLDRADGRAVAGRLEEELGCDVVAVPTALRSGGQHLVVTDVDSTLILDEVIEMIAAHAGVEAKVAEVTAAAMRGELDFAQSLHHRVSTLAGLRVEVLDEVQAAVRLTPGVPEMVRAVRRNGGVVGVVSGGFTEVVDPLVSGLRIDHALANRLEVEDGRLTGRVTGRVVDRAAKADALREWAELHAVPLERTVAVGDGANDLDMLATAGLGVAFCAQPAVRGAAHAAISTRRLDVLLPLLGY